MRIGHIATIVIVIFLIGNIYSPSKILEAQQRETPKIEHVKEWVEPITGMEFIWIPLGCFQMGQTEEEKQAILQECGKEDYQKGFMSELPQHHVCVEGFWMGKYEVTQAQWQHVMGTNPSYFQGVSLKMVSENHPVEQITWHDVQEFLHTLNDHAGKRLYRLPSEAEWEYACRAGTETAYNANEDAEKLWLYAWYSENSDGKTHPVGQLKPNAFGLFDMHGNVWEWCADPWHPNYEGAPTDGTVWNVGGNTDFRVRRGGSSINTPTFLRSATRFRFESDGEDGLIGFRVVMSAIRTP